MSELDIGAIGEIDEALSGRYRPEVWEQRITYYLRRDPEVCVVAEADGQVVGFMLGEVRSGEFGLEEPTGWIEVMGVAPEHRGQSIGRLLGERLLENLRQRGARTVRTLVDQGRPELAGFFAALGFEAAKIQPYVLRF
jgi:GNAT superfamily N-acetyltransferase